MSLFASNEENCSFGLPLFTVRSIKTPIVSGVVVLNSWNASVWPSVSTNYSQLWTTKRMVAAIKWIDQPYAKSHTKPEVVPLVVHSDQLDSDRYRRILISIYHHQFCAFWRLKGQLHRGYSVFGHWFILFCVWRRPSYWLLPIHQGQGELPMF